MLRLNLKNVVIMKYGVHAQEDVQNIIMRKKAEYQNCGKMFWGYNGVLCNPKTQVQPFLELNQLRGEETYLLLVRTLSEHNGMGYVGTELSYDKQIWEQTPNEIQVIGSKYALICEDLIECDIQLDMNEYVVAVGKSAQKPLHEYMKGRVDKACACFAPSESRTEKKIIQVSYFSKILNAVYIR